MIKEIWKQISSCPNYEVSNQGRVRNSVGKILKPQQRGAGYPALTLWHNHKQFFPYVHVLVAEAFIGPRLGHWTQIQVNHKDGNKMNNCFSNLEYVTCAENHLHASRLGLAHRFKITAEQVQEIKLKNQSAKETAKKFNIAVGTVYNIRMSNWSSTAARL